MLQISYLIQFNLRSTRLQIDRFRQDDENMSPIFKLSTIQSAYPLWLSWLKRPTVIHRQSGDRKFEPSRGRYVLSEFLFLCLLFFVHLVLHLDTYNRFCFVAAAYSLPSRISTETPQTSDERHLSAFFEGMFIAN